jgi:TolB-like protein
MNKTAVFLFVSCLWLFSYSADTERRNSVAVNNLVGQGVGETDAAVITDRIRTELLNTGSFRVMERSQMEAIFKEQGFQQSGACSDNACIVEMGQKLGVEQMIFGTIGRVGEIFTISLRMVNVATGEVLFSATEDCRCPVEEVLTTSAKNIAVKLDDAIQKATFGALHVKTEPAGASVLINQQKVGETEYSNDRFVPGKYALRIELPSYEPQAQDIVIDMNKAVNLFYKLEHTKVYKDSMEKAEKAIRDSIKTTAKKARIRKLIIRQIVFSGLAALAGGAGYYFNSKADKKLNEYHAAYNDYATAQAGSDFDKMWNNYTTLGKDADRLLLYRNLLYGTSGAFGAAFCVSFAFNF